MRQAARVDDNQAEIVKALRAVGAKVWCTHQVGHGFPDLLVGWEGALMLIEVKDGAKPPSKRKLTADEQAFFDEWHDYPVFVVESPLQAMVLLGAEADNHLTNPSPAGHTPNNGQEEGEAQNKA